MIQAEDRVGTVLVNKYKIESLVATGGMGAIFIARDPDGSESVKILDFGVAKFRELGQRASASPSAMSTCSTTPSSWPIPSSSDRPLDGLTVGQ